MTAATRLAALLLPLAAALAPTPAAAVVQASSTTFYFSGACTDCTGFGQAQLVLSNYSFGDAITSGNFVSFHYNGSNLVPGGFTITDTTNGVGGSIDAALPGPETFHVFGQTNFFSSAKDGSWQLGLTSQTDDFGTDGTYSPLPPIALPGLPTLPTTSVPEPISLAILGTGLIGTALIRRRRA